MKCQRLRVFIAEIICLAEDFSIKKEDNIDDDSDAEELSKIDFAGELAFQMDDVSSKT